MARQRVHWRSRAKPRASVLLFVHLNDAVEEAAGLLVKLTEAHAHARDGAAGHAHDLTLARSSDRPSASASSKSTMVPPAVDRRTTRTCRTADVDRLGAVKIENAFVADLHRHTDRHTQVTRLLVSALRAAFGREE